MKLFSWRKRSVDETTKIIEESKVTTSQAVAASSKVLSALDELEELLDDSRRKRANSRN